MHKIKTLGTIFIVLILLPLVSAGLWLSVPVLNRLNAEHKLDEGLSQNIFNFLQNSVGIASSLVLGATALIVAWKSVQLSKTQTLLTTMDLSAPVMADLRKDLVEFETHFREVVEATYSHARATAKLYVPLPDPEESRAATVVEVQDALDKEDLNARQQGTQTARGLRAIVSGIDSSREDLRAKMLAFVEWASSMERGVMFFELLNLAGKKGMSEDLHSLDFALSAVESSDDLEIKKDLNAKIAKFGPQQKLVRIGQHLRDPGALISVYNGDSIGEAPDKFDYADPMLGVSAWRELARPFMEMGKGDEPALLAEAQYEQMGDASHFILPLSARTFYMCMTDDRAKASSGSVLIDGLGGGMTNLATKAFLERFNTRRSPAPSYLLLRGMMAARDNCTIAAALEAYYLKLGINSGAAKSLSRTFMASLSDPIYEVDLRPVKKPRTLLRRLFS